MNEFGFRHIALTALALSVTLPVGHAVAQS